MPKETTYYEDYQHLDGVELLKVYAGMEQENMESTLQALKIEIGFYKELIDLYNSAFDTIPRDLIAMAYFFTDSHHYLSMAMLDLVRGHIVKAMGSTRVAIESLAYANRLLKATDDEDAKRLLDIWFHRDNGMKELQDFQKEFGISRLFPEKDKTIMTIRSDYDHACVGSHPNILSHAFRSEQSDSRLEMAFFDLPGDDPTGWYQRGIHNILRPHVRILNVYNAILGDRFSDRESWTNRLLEIDAKLLNRAVYLKDKFWSKEKD